MSGFFCSKKLKIVKKEKNYKNGISYAAAGGSSRFFNVVRAVLQISSFMVFFFVVVKVSQSHSLFAFPDRVPRWGGNRKAGSVDCLHQDIVFCGKSSDMSSRERGW